MQDLGKLLQRLLDHEVDFVLAGGFASVVHGSTIVTQDLDICLLINEEQIAKLKSALKDLNPRHRMNPSFQPSFLGDETDSAKMKNIYLVTDWGVLDVMSELPPAGDFSAVKGRAVPIRIFGKTCLVVSIDDLLTIKRAMNRPKDQQTILELERIKVLK